MANISTPSLSYKELAIKRELPHTLMGGTTDMRKARTKFTPQHPAEEDESYTVRLNSTFLYNGFVKTVHAMTGKIFSKDVIINHDVPEQIVELLDNIDNQGRNITSFLYDISKNALIDGISFALIDMAKINKDEFVTLLDIKENNINPYCILIDAESLIGFKHDNGFLTEIRIKQCLIDVDPNDEYKEIEVNQILKITPGHFELWREDKSKSKSTTTTTSSTQWFLYDSGETGLSYIPIVPFYANRTAFMEGEPPLMPLAELNLAHWISTSEQNKALTYARFAMLSIAGITKEEVNSIKVGPDQVLTSEDPSTKFAYIETSGAALAAGVNDISAIEKRMEHAGMTIRVQSVRGTTATEASIGSTDADSALIAFAVSIQDSANIMIDMIADRLGLSNGGTIEINKLFVARQPTGTMSEVQGAFSAGLITQETYLSEGKRRDFYADDLDINNEVAETTIIKDQVIDNIDNIDDTETLYETIDIHPIIDDLNIIKEKIDNLELIHKEQTKVEEQKPNIMQPMMDMSKIVDAIAAIPAPVVNIAPSAPVDLSPITDAINAIPTPPAPIINVVGADAPVIPPAPIIEVAAPVAPQPKTVSFKRDKNGNITGASID